MKKLFSAFLALTLVLAGLAFPVSATEVGLLTAADVTASGAVVSDDAYLSAVKVTPLAANQKVSLTFELTDSAFAVWLPATAADSSVEIVFSTENFGDSFEVVAGHKFSAVDLGYTGEITLSYIPSDVYSIYVYGAASDEASVLAGANGSLQQYEEEYLDLSEYDPDRYTNYYWGEDIVFNESFMVIKDEDGVVQPNAMMYEIDRVVSVKNSYLTKEYVYGADYYIEDGKLVIPEESSILKYSYDTVYKDTDPTGSYWETLDGGYVYAGQYNMYFVGYLNITYTVKDSWTGPVPEPKGFYLNNFMDKVERGEDVKILGIGDSIAGGANVSADIGETGVAPYAERWCDMVQSGLQLRYPNITVENNTIAQGGATATLAIDRMNEIVAYAPDLLIIEFGTNECMAGDPASTYVETLEKAIAAVNESLPNCDIILVSPIISNPLIFPVDWFYAYADALYSLEGDGVAVADATSIFQYAITRKDYIDMTGDFLCHPNDFSNRIFVQTILATIDRSAKAEGQYISRLANRLLTYRYESEFEAEQWAEYQAIATEGREAVLAAGSCEDALSVYMEYAKQLDAIYTIKDIIANSAIDVSKLAFNSTKPLETITTLANVASRYDDAENALSLVITNARNFSATIDYTKGDDIVSADGYDYVVFTAKAPLTNGTKAKAAKLTYTTASGDCTAVTVNLILDGKYHSYIIDMSGDAKWSGDISSLKLQPFASANTNDVLYVSSIVLATDAENAADISVERERIANKDAKEAVTYLMSDDATSAILKAEGGVAYLAGDVNGDERVNAVDSLLLRHYLVDETKTVANPAALDVDANGEIDASDALLLRKTIAGAVKGGYVDLSDAKVSYSNSERAAQIVLGKDNATVTVDLSESGLSGDMFKYVTVCAKRANGEALDVDVTLTYADGESVKTVSVPAADLFNADIAKFVEASGDILSISFTFNASAGETVYLDSFVFNSTISAAQNAVAVRVGAANLFS